MLKIDWDDLVKGNKGDWCFHHDDTYITIRYGDDTLDVVDIPVVGANAWQWDGNKESPTITPSILIRGLHGKPDLWHGFLTNGKVIEA